MDLMPEYIIAAVDGVWKIETTIEEIPGTIPFQKPGLVVTPTYVCEPLPYNASVDPRTVTSIRPVTSEDRNNQFRPREGDEYPGIYPHARTLIEVGDEKYFVIDDLTVLAALEPTPRNWAELTEAAKLIFHVQRLNPDAVKIPLAEATHPSGGRQRAKPGVSPAP